MYNINRSGVIDLYIFECTYGKLVSYFDAKYTETFIGLSSSLAVLIVYNHN